MKQAQMTWQTANGGTGSLIGVWEEMTTWFTPSKMLLERYRSASGKSSSYLIFYAGRGQSYPVGTFRTRKAALAELASFTDYAKMADRK